MCQSKLVDHKKLSSTDQPRSLLQRPLYTYENTSDTACYDTRISVISTFTYIDARHQHGLLICGLPLYRGQSRATTDMKLNCNLKLLISEA